MNRAIILAYHDIDTKNNPTEKKDLPTIQTVVNVDEFESQMHYLASAGYTVLSVTEYLDRLKKNKNNDRCIILTFDDGHYSNYNYALPILRKYSFHASFFIVVDFVGKPLYMGDYEIQELISCNMEIGSHGLTHAYLTQLTREEIIQEVVESKRLLEKRIGRQVDVFAYPGGHQNKKVVEIVKNAGYKAAVSCITGLNNARTNPFLLRRLEVRRGTSVREFRNALDTKSILFFQCIDMLKAVMKKSLGLRVYEGLRQKFFFLYPFKR